MQIFNGKTALGASEKAAEIFAEVIKNKPDAVIGLATGSSPIGMYSALAKKCEAGEISFKNVKSVNLDEYVGLSADHDQSYAYFMAKNFFDLIDIDKKNTHLPCGTAKDPKEECKAYDALIASMGGIDIQVLGIGNNGHIAFNEPADSFSKGTQLIELTDSTIEANSRFFASKSEVPTRALSMGIGQIISAKKIVMIALGKGKAEILEKAFFGPVTPEVPASILQFVRNVYVCADEEALSVILEKHPESVIG